MEIEKSYQGYKKWKDGSRQHILGSQAETLQDAIRYMRTHLEYFKRTDLSFDEQEIVDMGDYFIITLRNADEISSIREARKQLKLAPADTNLAH